MMTESKDTRYSEIRRQRPELFTNPSRCAIRLLLTAESITAAENVTKARLRNKGLPEEWAHVGVVYEDEYILVLRDAVEFANGSLGTYIRILPQRNGVAGVATLPVMEDKIVLVNHFRHSTRQWHWEVPRGFSELGDSIGESARRELSEEIQAEPLEVVSLGRLFTNTGLSTEEVALVLVRIATYGKTDDIEGISEIRLVNIAEFEDMVRGGDIDDSFTIALYARARLHGYI